jgi:predicted phage tail protein
LYIKSNKKARRKAPYIPTAKAGGFTALVGNALMIGTGFTPEEAWEDAINRWNNRVN